MQKITIIVLIILVILIIGGSYYVVQLNEHKLKEYSQLNEFALKKEKELTKDMQKISKQTETLAIAADKQSQKLEEMEIAQRIAICEKRKEDCERDIYNLKYGELAVYDQGKLMKGDRSKMIDKKNGYIVDWEKSIKEASKSHKENIQKRINQAKEDIAEIKIIIEKERIELNKLLLGKCKDYQDSCE